MTASLPENLKQELDALACSEGYTTELLYKEFKQILGGMLLLDPTIWDRLKPYAPKDFYGRLHDVIKPYKAKFLREDLENPSYSEEQKIELCRALFNIKGTRLLDVSKWYVALKGMMDWDTIGNLFETASSPENLKEKFDALACSEGYTTELLYKKFEKVLDVMLLLNNMDWD